MPSYRTGTVTAVLSERPGLQRVEVGDRRAYVLTELIGPVAVGDRVVLNTTAVDLGLGTGGWDVVHWNLAREAWSQPGRGGVLKLRYTSLQVDVGAAEGLKHDSAVHCDELMSLPKPALVRQIRSSCRECGIASAVHDAGEIVFADGPQGAAEGAPARGKHTIAPRFGSACQGDRRAPARVGPHRGEPAIGHECSVGDQVARPVALVAMR